MCRVPGFKMSMYEHDSVVSQPVSDPTMIQAAVDVDVRVLDKIVELLVRKIL